MLSPSPPTILPTDNTFCPPPPPPPLCLVFWSPLSSLSCTFPFFPDLCAHGSSYSVWKVGNWRIARAQMLLLRICCYVLVSSRIMLRRRSLTLGAAIAGVCMDVERVNLLTPTPVSTQGFKQKKSRCFTFPSFFPCDLFSHNKCVGSQLDNTLPQSAKRFSDYSICSAQCACTLPSVFFFFLNKEKRGRERQQSSCARETRCLLICHNRFGVFFPPDATRYSTSEAVIYVHFHQESHIKASESTRFASLRWASYTSWIADALQV